MLRLDRLRALVDVYPGVEREDEMVAAFDFCLHGKGGAAPSIDTAMHGLVDAPHVDHLHPDCGHRDRHGRRRRGADRKDIYGDKVVWVPWRRPGFQLGLDIAAIQRAAPEGGRLILGGHGITAWGATSEEGEPTRCGSSRPPHAYIAEHGKAEPFGPKSTGTSRCPTRNAERRQPRSPRRSAGIASRDQPMVGHFTDDRAVLEFLARSEHPRLAGLGTAAPTTSCARRSSRCCSTCRRDAASRSRRAACSELHEAYREDYRAYYERYAEPTTHRRCAAPTR